MTAMRHPEFAEGKAQDLGTARRAPVASPGILEESSCGTMCQAFWQNQSSAWAANPYELASGKEVDIYKVYVALRLTADMRRRRMSRSVSQGENH
jgi:hypothetical protein